MDVIDLLDPEDAAGRARLSAALAGAPPAAGPGLVRILEADPDGPGLLHLLLASDALPRALALLGLGGAPLEAYLAEPRDLLGLAGPPPDPAAVAAAAGLADLDALRALRRRTTLGVAARELTGELDAPAAAAILSDVAASLIEAALGLARARAERRFGPAAQQVPLVVLALGKLGGRELNYSSDVDLVLVRGDEADAGAATAVARHLVELVQEPGAAGRLYRVDLRLRPYGKSGELVPRRAALRDYYREHARPWELQALLKASAVAGDLELGRAVLADLAPLVFRDHLDARSIEEILRLRDRIAEEAAKGARDVKAGAGGIRDVEFAVQLLQLLHGGRLPALRVTGTLVGVERLLEARVLDGAEAGALSESYRFLRRLEHLLQLVGDREETRLPEEAALGPLAACLGLSAAELERRHAALRAQARRVLDALLRSAFRQGGRGDASLRDLLLDPRPDPAAARALLAERFRDPEAAWEHLQDLARERHSLLAPSGRARTLLAGLAPRLLQALASRPDPDRALRNLQRATSKLGAKATVYQLLAEATDALDLLVDLAAGSDVLCEVLAQHPGVFDEVIDRLLTRKPPRLDEVEAEVGAALASADPAAGLREVRALYLLVAGALDLGGRSNVQNTARALSEVAEGFLRAFVARARAQVAERHGGEPPGGRLALLALGKLAAREMSYASDVDLVVVWDGAAPAPDGAEPERFWAEVVQALLALGQGPASCEGSLLPIDLRLRPGGRSGALALSRPTFLAYYRGEGAGEVARDFERLALQKARPVAGELGEELTGELEQVLYGKAYGAELWDEVLEIRRRQIEAAELDDLKRGPGGTSDVELVASALALRRGGERPGVRQPNTVQLLGALEREGLLDQARHHELRTAYAFLRRAELRLRARTWQGRSVLPPPGPARTELARALGYQDVGAPGAAELHFTRELAFQRRRIEAICAALVAEDRASG